MTALFGVNGQAVSGDYGDTDLIRNGAIAQKFGVITIVMQANQNATTLDLSVTGKRGAEEAVKQASVFFIFFPTYLDVRPLYAFQCK